MRRPYLVILFGFFFCAARSQGPAGYWLSEEKSGFFEGLDGMEMRLDPQAGGLQGNVYYIWEHGIYYQQISLEGRAIPGDSVVLREVALVANRNGIFAGDCRGIFHLQYSHDARNEYLTGIWKKPPGSLARFPDTRVTFYRSISPDAAWNKQPSASPVKSGSKRLTKAIERAEANGMAVVPMTAPAAAPPPNLDSLRLVAFKTRKDSVEMTIPHHGDTAHVELYDDAIVDGDRVSLFMGDSLILKNYELLAQAKKLDVPLSSHDQTLYLYAENLGDIPPNTALMIIYVDDQRYEVRLSSDLRTNALVKFTKLP